MKRSLDDESDSSSNKRAESIRTYIFEPSYLSDFTIILPKGDRITLPKFSLCIHSEVFRTAISLGGSDKQLELTDEKDSLLEYEPMLRFLNYINYLITRSTWFPFRVMDPMPDSLSYSDPDPEPRENEKHTIYKFCYHPEFDVGSIACNENDMFGFFDKKVPKVNYLLLDWDVIRLAQRYQVKGMLRAAKDIIYEYTRFNLVFEQIVANLFMINKYGLKNELDLNKLVDVLIQKESGLFLNARNITSLKEANVWNMLLDKKCIKLMEY